MRQIISKRLVSMSLFLFLLIFYSFECFAYPSASDTIYDYAPVPSADGYAFFTTMPPYSPNVLNGNYKAINVFSDYIYSGCPVTTYTYSGSEFQVWRLRIAYYGNQLSGYSLYCYTPGPYQNYVLQIRRLGSTPEVNISTLVGNYARDVDIFDGSVDRDYLNAESWVKLATEPRSIHNSRMYITLGSNMTNYPGNYLYWASSKSGAMSFYYRCLGSQQSIYSPVDETIN